MASVASVRGEFADPTDGGLFVLINRRRDRMKILHFDEGRVLVALSSARGRDVRRVAGTDQSCCLIIDGAQLAMLLSGRLARRSHRPVKRYAGRMRKKPLKPSSCLRGHGSQRSRVARRKNVGFFFCALWMSAGRMEEAARMFAWTLYVTVERRTRRRGKSTLRTAAQQDIELQTKDLLIQQLEQERCDECRPGLQQAGRATVSQSQRASHRRSRPVAAGSRRYG